MVGSHLDTRFGSGGDLHISRNRGARIFAGVPESNATNVPSAAANNTQAGNTLFDLVRPPDRASVAVFAYFEDGQKGLLGNVNSADPFHSFLAFFLFFQKFALARNVTAVALGNNVLANG